MGKFYVTIATNCLKYKLCKDDIQKIYSIKKRKIPSSPAFPHFEKDQEYEENTSCDESAIEFEPIEFFPVKQRAGE
jgi:hypothetical protein